MPECGIFISHLGLGDLLLLLPALAQIINAVPKLYITCKKSNYNTFSKFIISSNVDFILIDNFPNIHDEAAQIHASLADIAKTHTITHIYRCGMYQSGELRHPFIDLPTNFYKDLGIDYYSAKAAYNIPTTTKAIQLYNDLLSHQKPFIFMHTSSSNYKLELEVNTSGTTTLIINPEENMYTPEHPFHTIAAKFVRSSTNGITIIDYKKILENAEEIHLIDSAYFCFATLLKTQASIKNIFIRNGAEYKTLTSDGLWTTVALV
jgi:hypothetical protein